MKTLLLLTRSFPFDDGEEFLAAELRYVSGFDRILICPCGLGRASVPTRKLPEGIRCIRIIKKPFGKFYYLRLLFRPCVQAELWRLLLTGKCRPDRVHEMLFFLKKAEGTATGLKEAVPVSPGDSMVIYSYWLYDMAAAGAMFTDFLRMRGVKVRLISRAHGFDIHASRSKTGYLPMRQFLFQRMDRIYPCSDDGASALRREAGRFSGKIKRSYLGTEDCGLGAPSQVPFHIVTCSYLLPVKRLNLLIKALMRADFRVVWTHIGSGPLDSEIRELAAQLPPQVTAEFTGGMENRRVLEYYRTHPVSAFVNVSASEGLPVAVMEAFSFGIPAIATDVGGTHEIVSDGGNGFLIPQDFSPEQLLEAFCRLEKMTEPDYQNLCAGARKTWEEKFSAAKNYGRFYKEIGTWN